MKIKAKRILLLIAIPLLLVAAAFLYAYFYKITGLALFCVFHKITGLYCPGCGNSRAALALLRFDFKTAFLSNRIIFAEIAYLVYLYSYASIKYVREGKFTFYGTSKIINISFLVLLFIWLIIRNIFGF